ncbi:hypothetical protein SCUCBS95973_002923 [Sporothrix curviconia]|uniref:Aminoglycoside phosphotransferase domain-containing protein n=1 Tax=Sporothrix curviconia TaxID=1260050 RepID=A0ABP0BB04_9PEZI
MNWAITVTFEDGAEWIFRAPIPGKYPDDVTAALIASEVATIQCIAQRTTVPVPTIFAFSPHKDNDIGVPYILQSKAKGTCLLDYSIRAATGKGAHLTDEQCALVMRQLGDFTEQLSRVRFPQIGSLVRHDDDGSTGDYAIGPCLAPAFVWSHRHLLDNLKRGPFDRQDAYFAALAEALFHHAQELPMEHHALLAPLPVADEYLDSDNSRDSKAYLAAMGRWNDFLAVGSKIDHSRNRFAFCMAANVLRESIVPILCDKNGDDTRPCPCADEGFPLMHPDLNVGNIFVDEAMNVTCIIDWSSATTAPLVELFAVPRLWDQSVIAPASSADPFRQALQICALQEREGEAASQGARWWALTDTAFAFQRLTRLCSSHDYDDFVACISSAACAGLGRGEDCGALTAVDTVLDLLGEHAERASSKALLAEMQEDNPTPGEVAALEQVSFREADRKAASDRLAVARKLTVVWHMNPRFVADARLWKWLARALGEQE